MSTPTLVWFRLDLRLQDHPALQEAAKQGPVLPVFIDSPDEDAPWEPGGASRWWLHQSLKQFTASLEAKGSRLILKKGPALETLLALARETGARQVFWNRCYEPQAIARDTRIKKGLRDAGLTAESFRGNLLFEPFEIKNLSGQPYKVYTPFWNNLLAAAAKIPSPLPAPPKLPPPAAWPASLKLAALGLEPEIDWAGGMRKSWTPGEDGARAELRSFTRSVPEYSEERDRPDHTGTSRLSPHLHFGEITPRQVWHHFHGKPKTLPYLRQIVWREFAHHLLYHFPHTPLEPLREEFKKFPWKKNAALFRKWQKGLTGYPVVDAGMRELWHTGWMHNRVRMIAASFLVKDLLIPWQEGARWFWDTLVDADLANNTMGWQWVAGCGADAAPFFRIFNPVSQGEKFDPRGDYVRRWVPELSGLPEKWIHKPWLAPEEVLKKANVAVGKNYPAPVVQHDMARKVALLSYEHLRA